MSIFGAFFGRAKIKKSSREKFFSIVTAEMDLEGRTDLRRTEKAGVVFNPVESQFFENLDTEMRDLLATPPAFDEVAQRLEQVLRKRLGYAA